MTFINLGKLFFKRLLLNVLKDRRYLLYSDIDLETNNGVFRKMGSLIVKSKLPRKEKMMSI